MAIEFQCGCGFSMRAASAHAGLMARCPGCGSLLRVPGGLAMAEIRQASRSAVDGSHHALPGAENQVGEDAASQPEASPNESSGAVEMGKAVILDANAAEATIPCPVCAKDILPYAVRCRHCGQFIDENRRRQKKQGARVAKMAVLALALGALAFIPLVGLVSVALGIAAIVRIRRNPHALEGIWLARAAVFLGICGTAYTVAARLL